MTEQEFIQTFHIVASEVDAAFISFQSYEELNHLARTDKDISNVLNADAEFWQGYRSALQALLFGATNRLFDRTSGAITVQTIVTAVLGNIQLFSKDRLSARMMSKGPKPVWFDDFMASAWVPTDASQLRHLQRALNQHVSRVEAYRRIRHNVYAHRLMADEKAAAELFPSTNRAELGETIDFLKDLVHVIQDLFNDGREPVLSRNDLTHAKQIARQSVGKVLRKLVACSVVPNAVDDAVDKDRREP
jgi:hypothetical protein